MSQAKLKNSEMHKLVVRVDKNDAEFIRRLSFMHNQSINKTLTEMIQAMRKRLQNDGPMLP